MLPSVTRKMNLYLIINRHYTERSTCDEPRIIFQAVTVIPGDVEYPDLDFSCGGESGDVPSVIMSLKQLLQQIPEFFGAFNQNALKLLR